MKRARGDADLRTTIATVIAMVPGFVFPFLLTLKLGAGDSDTLLLAMSIMTTIISVMGSSIELNTVSEFGRQLTEAGRPSDGAMRDYMRRVRSFGFRAVCVVGAALTVMYSLAFSVVTWGFVVLCSVMLGASITAIYSSLNSGILISAGKASIPIATHALRPALPIVLLISSPQAPLALFALAFGLGEAVRWGVLARFRRRALDARRPIETAELETRGMIWQATSAGVSQGSPAVDRVFLASATTGSVSAYELADKLYFALIQFLNYGFLVRRVGRWSRLPMVPRPEGARLLKKDLLMLISVAAVLALGGILVLYLLAFLDVSETWRKGAHWAMLLMFTAPLTIWSSSSSRLLIIARKQRYLLWFSLLNVTANLVFNVIFFTLFGAVGIILATISTRILSASAYAIILRFVVPKMLGSALES